MKIDFVRSGGLAGLRLAVSVDTESLPVEDASRLVQLVEGAGFFGLEQASPDASPGRDRFEYRLTIESQIWGRNAVVLPEPAVPEELRPLLDHLTALAMRRERPDDAGRRQGKSDA
ncbi:MAG: protealysin inhibitor emfourin [Chloroflexota bacterium]